MDLVCGHQCRGYLAIVSGTLRLVARSDIRSQYLQGYAPGWIERSDGGGLYHAIDLCMFTVVDRYLS